MSGKDRKRDLGEDERALWSEFTKKIAPLTKRPARVEQDDDAAPVPKAKAAKPKPIAAAPKIEARPAPKPVQPIPLGRREKQRVARGKDSIGARLDLHGHTQAEAHGALSRFLHTARAREHRTVLVITGKSGVLRRQVPMWLALPEFSVLVVGYDTAAIRHGGEGALYVRLRRIKE